MNQLDLIRQAVKRSALATELLNQLLAVQTFDDQKIVTRDQAAEEVIRLMAEFTKETRELNRLLGQFLENRNNHR